MTLMLFILDPALAQLEPAYLERCGEVDDRSACVDLGSSFVGDEVQLEQDADKFLKVKNPVHKFIIQKVQKFRTGTRQVPVPTFA